MNLSKPNKGMVEAQDDGARLLSQLIEFYDAILDLARPILAARIDVSYARARAEDAKAIASLHP